MAALCPGVQYGLSSQQNFSENKDLIFVKLTDSSLRAIEEYLKNQKKFNFAVRPKIRFLGNENGELSFPSQHNDSGYATFSFGMSSTADMEGPAGSFECIQANPPKGPLECLGSIRYKLRVLANDDVYEATRNRMTEAEDKYKNKCTREIKPNQTDIGRKVKVKQPLSSSSSSRPSMLTSSASSLPSAQPTRPTLSMRETLMKGTGSYQHPSPVKPPQGNPQPPLAPSSSMANGLSNGLSNNHISSSQRSTVQHNNRKQPVSEVARRPLRERLIQLLALRPFKKIELHDRLSKEGLRASTSMSTVLKQVAYLKDNCYYLNRPMWNEVNDDWPFYTESEKQVVKRRKPQNLTPPGGSDGGSSGSGQSPTSIHPGSPISSTNYVVPGAANKRPGYSEGGDGLPYKKPRIAHEAKNNSQSQQSTYGGDANLGGGGGYNKQRTASELAYRQSDSGYSRSPIEQNNSQRRPATDLRDASNMNPRSRESPPNGYYHPYDNLQSADDDRNKRQSDSANGLTFGVSREKCFRSGSPVNGNLMTDDSRRAPKSPIMQNPLATNGIQREKDRRNNMNNNNNNNNNHKVTSSSQRGVARVSPESQTERLPPTSAVDASPTRIGMMDEDEYPDYKKQYVEITSVEQKRAYKADFNADYAEYRKLFPIVDRVSKRFSQLEERLKQEDVDGPRYKDIKKQIFREYQNQKKDLEHVKAKSRFMYLHDKLSHIKRLVSDYDQAQTGVIIC